MKRILAIILIINILIISGCNEVNVKDENNTNIDKNYKKNEKSENNSDDIKYDIETKYKNVKLDSSVKLIRFINENINEVDKKFADKMIVELIKTIKKDDLIKANDYLYGNNSKKVKENIIEAAYIVSENKLHILGDDKDIFIENIKNMKIKNELKNYSDKFLGLLIYEGSYYAVIDYGHIKNKYGKYLSDEFNTYLKYLDEENRNRMRIEGYLNISVEELIIRISNYELFLKNNSDFEFVENIKNLYMTGIYELFIPTPFFNTLKNNKKSNDQLMEAYNHFIKRDDLEVTKTAAEEMLEYIKNHKEEDFQNDHYKDLYLKGNEIYRNISVLIDQIYLRKIDNKTKEKLVKVSKEIMNLLKNKRYFDLADYVHPEKGIRFSPYTYVNENKDVVLSRKELKNKNIGETEFIWGNYDGKGTEIILSTDNYINRFVYDNDYLNTENLNINKYIQRGNNFNNVFKTYPNSVIIEYCKPGTGGNHKIDWGSIKLIFTKFEEKYYLEGIVHSEWTI